MTEQLSDSRQLVTNVSKNGKVRVAVLDDHRLSRDAVVSALKRQRSISVCFVAETDSSERLLSVRPSSILIGLIGGSDLPERLSRMAHNLTGTSLITYAFAPVPDAVINISSRLGVITHFDHNERLDVLARTVACQGRRANNDDSEEYGVLVSKDVESRINTLLSAREIAVWNALGEGICHREIGVRLGINRKTVSTFCSRIRDKVRIPKSIGLSCCAARWPHKVPASRIVEQ